MQLTYVLLVCFFASHYVLSFFYRCSLHIPLCHCSHPFPLSCALYCTHSHCSSLDKYCHTTKWDGSQNIKLPFSLLFPLKLRLPCLTPNPSQNCDLHKPSSQLGISPLSHLATTLLLCCHAPQHSLPRDLSMHFQCFQGRSSPVCLLFSDGP